VVDILAKFGLPIEGLVVVLVNGVYADLGHVLEEGDVVTAFPAMGGGDDSLHIS
jgi:molybdopterin converting factor small subunit